MSVRLLKRARGGDRRSNELVDVVEELRARSLWMGCELHGRAHPIVQSQLENKGKLARLLRTGKGG